MNKKKLEILRDQINQLDNDMLNILDKRSNIVTKIGKLKNKADGVVDESREQLVLDRLLSLSKGKYPKNIIIRIWRELFEASSRLQLENKSSIFLPGPTILDHQPSFLVTGLMPVTY